MEKQWYKSLTIWGGILYGLSQVCKVIPPALPAVPILEALAAVLGATGVRNAIAANGAGK